MQPNDPNSPNNDNNVQNNQFPVQPNGQPPVSSNAPAGQDPAQTLGVVGLILAIFVPIAGLIVSIIARSKSRKAGHPGTIALVGIILSAVTILISVLFFMLLVVAQQGVKDETETNQQEYITQGFDVPNDPASDNPF